MKGILITVLLTVQVGSLMGQDPKVIDRLSADKFKTGNALYLWDDGERIKYIKDLTEKNEKASYLNKDDYFAFKGKNLFAMYFEFYNPLRRTIKLKSSYADDPSQEAYDQFLKQFAATFESIAKPEKLDLKSLAALNAEEKQQLGTLSAQIKSMNPDSVFVLPPIRTAPISTGAPTVLSFQPKVKSILLKDWLYAIMSVPKYEPALDKILTDLTAKVENYLYFETDIGGAKKSVDEHIKSMTDVLYEKTLMDDLVAQLKLAVALRDELNKLSEDKTGIPATVRELAKVVESPTGITMNPALNAYCSNTATWLHLQVRPDMEARKAKIKAFDTFVTKLDKQVAKLVTRLKSYDTQRFVLVEELEMIRSKDLDIKLTIRNLAREGNVKDSLTTQFKVIFSSAPAYFSSSIIYCNMLFNNYALGGTGSNVIQNTETKKYVLPAAFINYLVGFHNSQLYLMPQVGVTVGKEYPTILTGLGVGYGNRLSISGGVAFLFNTKLVGHTTGETLPAGTTIADVTATYVDTSTYFSFNYRLGKK